MCANPISKPKCSPILFLSSTGDNKQSNTLSGNTHPGTRTLEMFKTSLKTS